MINDRLELLGVLAEATKSSRRVHGAMLVHWPGFLGAPLVLRDTRCAHLRSGRRIR
jgi:hypothetical protein